MLPAASPRRLRSRLTVLATVAAVLLPGGAVALADEPDRPRTEDEARSELRLAILHGLARSDPGAFGYPDEPAADELVWAEDLARVARDWSDQMANTGSISHNLQWLSERNRVGENVAYLQARSDVPGWADDAAARLMDNWMDSPGHRGNLLHDAYGEVGIGVSIAEPGGGSGSLVEVYATAVFRDPGDAELAGHPGDRVRDIDAACPQQAVPDSGLADVTLDSHRRAVDCLVWWEVAEGTSATTFEPDRQVTRGQLATFVVRAIRASGGSLPEGEATFGDVAPDATHAAAIDALAAAGLIQGYGDGTFRPEEPVQRGHLARFLMGGHEHVTDRELPDSDGGWFSDTAGSEHTDAIDRGVEAGWVAGYPDGRFRPTEPVRRGHMAVFLARWLDQLVADQVAELPAADG